MKKIFLSLVFLFYLLDTQAQDSIYYIKSKIPLEYNLPFQINKKDTGYVIGVIKSVVINPPFTIINISYEYLAQDSTTIILDKNFILPNKTYVDGLYNGIKSGLPGTITSYSDFNAKAFILGFQYEMATTWNISANQIDIKRKKQ